MNKTPSKIRPQSAAATAAGPYTIGSSKQHVSGHNTPSKDFDVWGQTSTESPSQHQQRPQTAGATGFNNTYTGPPNTFAKRAGPPLNSSFMGNFKSAYSDINAPGGQPAPPAPP